MAPWTASSTSRPGDPSCDYNVLMFVFLENWTPASRRSRPPNISKVVHNVAKYYLQKRTLYIKTKIY